MNKLIKALRTSEMIQKRVKDELGRYIYLLNSGENRFIAQSDLCTFAFNNVVNLQIESGYLNMKELIAVLKHAEPDVSIVKTITPNESENSKIDTRIKRDLLTEQNDLKSLFDAIVTLSIVFKDKEKTDINRVIVSQDSIYCFNGSIALEHWHGLNLDMQPFALNADQIAILKKFKNPTKLSMIENDCLEFTFNDDEEIKFFRPTFKNNNDITLDKINAVLHSETGYKYYLTDSNAQKLNEECDILISKEIESIDMNKQFFPLCFDNVDRPFNVKRLKLVLTFIKEFSFNNHSIDQNNKLYFTKNNIRGILMGLKNK